MKRNKAIISICVILVFAIVMALAAGCQIKGDDGTHLDNNKEGISIVLNGADRGITFAVTAGENRSDIESLISVVHVATGEVQNVDIVAKGNGRYIVYPPTGRYTKGEIYKINIKDPLCFEEQDAKVKEIVFTVTQDSTESIKCIDGVIQFDKGRISGQTDYFAKRENSEQQEKFGTFNLQANGAEVNVGDVILVNDDANNSQEAYKIEKSTKIAEGMLNIAYVKPQMNEVYTEFNVSDSKGTDFGEVEFIYDELAEAVENSELAQAAVSFFGAKPTFNFDVKKVEDIIKVKVGMTIPGVVAIDDFKTDIVIEFDCAIKVVADVNVDMDGNEVDAGVIAYVYNTVDTTVKLQSGYDYSDVTNLTDVIEKMAQMEEAEAGVSAPIFTWIIPIANGAVSVRYQCDLTFSFSFAGSFGVKISSDFNYMIGATYDKVSGVDTFAQVLDKDPVKSVEIDLSGSAKMKLGLANTLSLDVLAGVLGLGIRAEVGNFNGLYGFLNSGNLLDENSTVSASLYFEGGFYYDIDLLLAISIGRIANISIGDISKAIDITQGEIVLYKAGKESVITDIVSNNTIVLSAVETKLPEYNAFGYNLKNRGATYPTTVSLDSVEYSGSDLAISNGVITVLNPERKFSKLLTLQYDTGYGKIIEVKTTFKYDGTVYMDKADFDYNKSNAATNKNNIEIKLSGTMINGSEEVSANIDGARYNAGTVTIPFESVAALENGTHSVEIKVNDATCYASINVSGVATVSSYRRGSEYLVFTAEQIANMSNGEDFAGKTFVLQNDIDMKGAVISTVAVFNGVLNGNGYTISNYTVEGEQDGNVAFIGVNTGVIKNVTFEGSVNATLAVKTGRDYKVAGVVADNRGTVENVTFNGAVNVETTTLNAFVTVKVMAAVAEGDASGVTANASIKAVAKFDIANLTFFIDGSVEEVETSCTNAAVKGGALVKFVTL